MRKRMPMVFLLSIVWVPAVLSVSSPSPAQTPPPELTIVRILVPELDLFDDKGRNVGVMKTADLTLPLPVREKAPNGRLKIRLPDGRLVWIDGSRVTFQPSKDVPPCDPGRKMVAGATRGSGERCR
jgi:hypothetical protein